MGYTFRYKEARNFTYAPGFVGTGADGNAGKQGDNGTSLYFSEFDLNNSYDIELALQKIENNYVLSRTGETFLTNRVYKANDILLSENGNFYRIVESSNTSLFKNFKFDIEYMGKIAGNTITNVYQMYMFDITGTHFITNDDLPENQFRELRYFNPITRSCVPTNRSEKSATRIESSGDDGFAVLDKITNEDFNLYGSWIKLLGLTLEDYTSLYTRKTTTNEYGETNTEAGLVGEKYSFRIDLKNTKYLDGKSLPNSDYSEKTGGMNTKDGPVKYDMYVPLEFNDIATVQSAKPGWLFSDARMKLFRDIYPDEDYVVSKTKTSDCAKPIYLSDYSMDMVHPSGNNIKCTMNNDQTFWYKSGVNAAYAKNMHIGGIHIPNNLKLGPESYIFYNEDDPDDVLKRNITICRNTINRFTSGNVFECTDDQGDDSVDLALTINKYPTYAVGLGVCDIDIYNQYTQSVIENAYEDCDIVQLSRSEIGLNARSGDSCYFSGMYIHPSIDYYVERSIVAHGYDYDENYNKKQEQLNNIKNNVPLKIIEYVSSPDNKYYIIAEDNSTKEVSVYAINLSLITDMRGRYIMLNKIKSDEGKTTDYNCRLVVFANNPDDPYNPPTA